MHSTCSRLTKIFFNQKTLRRKQPEKKFTSLPQRCDAKGGREGNRILCGCVLCFISLLEVGEEEEGAAAAAYEVKNIRKVETF
jgi:soluble cytochrome b562